MTWHIRYVCLLHWLWCLGSKLLSGGQSCWLWNMAGQRGAENWLKWFPTQAGRAAVWAATCRWRSGSNHLLSPRMLHVCERDGENRHFYTSLPRSVCMHSPSRVLCLCESERATAGGLFMSLKSVCRAALLSSWGMALWHLTQAPLRGSLQSRHQHKIQNNEK